MSDNVECPEDFEENFTGMENAFALFLKGTEVMGGNMCTVTVFIIHPSYGITFFPQKAVQLCYLLKLLIPLTPTPPPSPTFIANFFPIIH